MKSSSWVARLGLLVVLVVAAVVVFVRRDVHGAMGTTLRYDDFEFTVLGVVTHASIGAVRPRGVFRVVRLEVRNAAARVDYDPKHHRAVLVDGAGAHLEVDAAGQTAWDALHPSTMPAVLHAGAAGVQELVFDAPAGAPLELAISWGGALVDTLDWLVMGERRIALP